MAEEVKLTAHGPGACTLDISNDVGYGILGWYGKEEVDMIYVGVSLDDLYLRILTIHALHGRKDIGAQAMLEYLFSVFCAKHKVVLGVVHTVTQLVVFSAHTG